MFAYQLVSWRRLGPVVKLFQLLNDKENDLSEVLCAQASPKPVNVAKGHRYHTAMLDLGHWLLLLHHFSIP